MEDKNEEMKRKFAASRQADQATVEELQAELVHLRRCREFEALKEEANVLHCKRKNVMKEQRRKLEEQLAEIKESTAKLERVKESLIRKKIGSNKRFSHVKCLDDELDHEGNE